MAGPVFSPEMIAHYAQQIPPEAPQQAQAAPPKPDRGLLNKLGLPVLIGGQAADLLTTLHGLKTIPGAQEGNPLMPSSPLGIAATKAATTAALAYLAEHLANKGSRKAALITALAGGGIGAGAAIHNARLMSGSK